MSTPETRKPSFDAIVDAIRRDEPTRAEIEAAADRVRASLGFDAPVRGSSSIHIESCEGFQSLIPAYLTGSLPAATALLLEDHSRECIPCRRALIAARTPAPSAAGSASSVRRPALARLAAAAALAAVALLAGYTAWRALPGLAGAGPLRVMRVDGSLYQVKDGALVPLTAGMTVPASDVVRTGSDSGALLQLADGSRVEMRDRTEFGVSRRRSGSTIRLANGSIIVEASPQGSGHLDVATDDCLVSVKGTIFAVNHGTKGSRVSVVEGSVNVDAGGSSRLLKPGDQTTTSESLGSIRVEDEIAWSRDSARYAQLLKELASLRDDLNARVPNPKLRYGSDLLDRLPADTVLYVAIPNLTDALVEARKVFMEHVAQTGALQEWWNEHMQNPQSEREMDAAFNHIREVGSQLGDEIVVSFSLRADGNLQAPVVTSRVRDAEALRAALAKEHAELQAAVAFDGAFVTIAPEGRASARTSSGGFASSRLGLKLAASYADGVSWLFGADLGAILDRAAGEAKSRGDDGARLATTWQKMGILDARTLVVERDENPDGAEMRAELAFDSARHGLADWLAAPAPMAALDFVSPDAAFAAAAVVKRPEALLAEALSWLGADSVETQRHLDEFRKETDVDPLHDLAGSLGGDVAVALDGPVLPVPSWKIAIEVYDAARLQSSIEKLARWLNDRLEASGKPQRVLLSSEVSGNRTDWVLRFTSPDAEENHVMRYTIVDGYLVAAPSRTLLDRAIQQRADGYTLSRSKTFAALLPRDGEVNVSALVWQNLGPTLRPVASQMASIVAPDQRQVLDAMAAESRPTLVAAYAENDRIVVGSRGDAGFGSMLGSMISANQLGAVGSMLSDIRRHEHDAPAPTP